MTPSKISDRKKQSRICYFLIWIPLMSYIYLYSFVLFFPKSPSREQLQKECSELKAIFAGENETFFPNNENLTENLRMSMATAKKYDNTLNGLKIKLNITEPKISIALLVIIKDEKSFGGTRTIHDFLDMIQNLDFPKNEISLNILVSDHGYYIKLLHDLKTLAPEYAKRSVFFRDLGLSLRREERHQNDRQKERRAALAKYRNILMSLAFSNNNFENNEKDTYMLWIDGDMEFLPPDLLNGLMVAKKDIITPRCDKGTSLFDMNTWVGPRKEPADKSAYVDKLFVPYSITPVAKHLDAFTHRDEKFVKVDSVGGTVLLIKSVVHRQGASFPPMYIIGAFWDTVGGFDGIETEGLCYIAHAMGYSCWGAPFVIVRHHYS